MSKVIKTAVTEKLGIKYPIFQGGMAWIVNAEMVAAVANAGGLGILPSGTCADADALRSELKKIKELTDKPYAVNFPLCRLLQASIIPLTSRFASRRA